MTKTKTLGLSLTAVLASLLVVGTTTAFGGNGPDYLDILNSIIFENPTHVSVKINVAANPIPTGPGAYGTGALTDGTLIVTTTHGGILDSETQGGDATNPIPHNHYVNLEPTVDNPDFQGDCNDLDADARVESLSFESPGIAMWPENMYKIWEVPKASPPGLYHDALTNDQQDFTLGNMAPGYQTVSFALGLGAPGEVCVFIAEVNDATLEELIKQVGGQLLSIDSAALLIGGLQSSAIWVLPAIAGVAGVSAYFVRARINKD